MNLFKQQELMEQVNLEYFGKLYLLWAEMGAVDVAFTEATVGAGISTVVLVATIFHLRRKSND